MLSCVLCKCQLITVVAHSLQIENKPIHHRFPMT
jgi:hypothetical protein